MSELNKVPTEVEDYLAHWSSSFGVVNFNSEVMGVYVEPLCKEARRENTAVFPEVECASDDGRKAILLALIGFKWTAVSVWSYSRKTPFLNEILNM